MNEQLCDWIERELELDTLADKLRDALKQRGSIEHFVLEILSFSSIYTTGELSRIEGTLEKLKNEKDIERQKYKADNLFQDEEYAAAMLVYQSILRSDKDESVDAKFYGKVYGCVGACYGRMFLYEESAKMYEEAFMICEEATMLEAYLYACYHYMSQEEYQVLLSKSEIYVQFDERIKQKIQEVKNEVKVSASEEQLSDWKQQYRPH